MQLNPVAVDYAQGSCCLLNEVITTGKESYEGLCVSDEVAAAIKEARANKSPHVQAVKSFGMACCKSNSSQCMSVEPAFLFLSSPPVIAYPASFKGSIQNIANATSYAQAVTDEITAGGDNCSRVIFVGAFCGAK